MTGPPGKSPWVTDLPKDKEPVWGWNQRSPRSPSMVSFCLTMPHPPHFRFTFFSPTLFASISSWQWLMRPWVGMHKTVNLNPAIPLLDICLRERKHMPSKWLGHEFFFCIFIHNNKKLNTTQVSIDRWLHKLWFMSRNITHQYNVV